MGLVVQGGHLSLVVPSPVDAGCRTCYICNEIDHVTRECPLGVIRDTPISSMKGRGITRGVRCRGYEAHGGGRGGPKVSAQRSLS